MRREGYAPLLDYAAIGDGSLDLLCLPDLDPGAIVGGFVSLAT